MLRAQVFLAVQAVELEMPSGKHQPDIYGIRKNLPQLVVTGSLTIIIGFTLQLHTVTLR
jgi:hypothetical protein